MSHSKVRRDGGVLKNPFPKLIVGIPMCVAFCSICSDIPMYVSVKFSLYPMFDVRSYIEDYGHMPKVPCPCARDFQVIFNIPKILDEFMRTRLPPICTYLLVKSKFGGIPDSLRIWIDLE